MVGASCSIVDVSGIGFRCGGTVCFLTYPMAYVEGSVS